MEQTRLARADQSDDASNYFSNGVDEVTWKDGDDDVSATYHVANDQITVTKTDQDGNMTGRKVYAANGATESETTNNGDGTQTTLLYDTSGGPGNEIITVRAIDDISDDGSALDYISAYYAYSLTGVNDGIWITPLFGMIPASLSSILTAMAFSPGRLHRLQRSGTLEPFLCRPSTIMPMVAS